MEQAIAAAGKLKPEIRLAQAVSEFGASLAPKHAVAFKNFHSQSRPVPQDAIRITEELNRDGARSHRGWKPFGTRLVKILERVQVFTSIGDVLIGGSQNMIACGVWAVVRVSLTLATSHAAFFDKITMIWMTLGQTSMNHEKLAALFPQSNELQSAVCEYLICVVQLCRTIADFMAKSPLSQLVSPLVSSRSFDKDVGDLKSQLDIWSACINRQITTLAVDTALTTGRDVRWLRQVFDSKTKADKLSLYEEKRSKLLQLLSPRHAELQSNWRRERRKGSVEWLFENPLYQSWRDNFRPDTLLLHGSLGSGKTVLMANMVGHLHMAASADIANSAGSSPARPIVASFFCQKDTATRFDHNLVIGSLLRQILDQTDSTSLSECLDDIPSLEINMSAFLLIISRRVPYTRAIYVILDGFDVGSVDRLVEVELLLQDLRTLDQKLDLHLCISIRTPSAGLQRLVTSLFTCKFLSMNQTEKDVEVSSYINAELDRRAPNSNLPSELVELMKQALIAGANGMFLWAALHIEALLPLYRRKALSPRDIERLLDQLPPSLEEVYNNLLAQIDDKRYKSSIFQIVVNSKRALTPAELVVALNVKPYNTIWDASSLPSNPDAAIASCSGGLLEIDEEDGAVYFIHHSAIIHVIDEEEDLKSDTSIRSQFSSSVRQGQEYVGAICITYLNLAIHDRRIVKRDKEMDAMGVVEAVKKSTSVGGNNNLTWALSKFMQRSNNTRSGVDLVRVLRDIERLQQPASDLGALAFLDYANSHWHLHISHEIRKTPDPTLLRKIFNGQLNHVKLPWVVAKKSLVEWCITSEDEYLFPWMVQNDTIFDPGRNRLDDVADFCSARPADKDSRIWLGKSAALAPVLTMSLNRLIWTDVRHAESYRKLLLIGASPRTKIVAPERAWAQWNSLDLLMHRMHQNRKVEDTWEATRKPFPIDEAGFSPPSLPINWKSNMCM
ncbi:hypothetical protein F5X68DRAFT_143782 [Plectosphaerella plurivora]|uniref:Nephrocystin 3-like N-terminal domain-containing protein n=1 Tax=Plectosphaerella plurivora TaxID=936078 RepID=A0A9P8UZF7_9PEZI|nr:hypothetical protein F5X68DRAFT_143782 [Plectosphaerella plurivora]